MPRKISLYLLFSVAILLILWFAYSVPYAGFIFLLLSALAIIVFAVIIIIKFIKKGNKRKAIVVTSFLIFVFILGTLINLFVPYPSIITATTNSPSSKIKMLYQTDQYDRKTLKSYISAKYSNLVSKRDNLRLEEANSIYAKYEKGEIELSPQDKHDLAMIFQHGKSTANYEIAYSLAKEAFHEDSTIQNSKWLMEATYDRLQVSQGKPQKYGTQHERKAIARHVLLPSQAPRVIPSAEERALIIALDERMVAPGDSNAILKREYEWGSSAYRLGYRGVPQWQNYADGRLVNPGYYHSRIDQFVFAANFSPLPGSDCAYEFNDPSYFRTRNRNGLTGLVHDGSGALVQLNKPVWYPYFHKRSPLPFLNMEVAYEVLDSMWVDQWTPLEKRVVIKLYHRDSMLDVFFPERTVVAPFNMHEFRSAYQVIKSHFNSRYQSHCEPLGHNINESNIFKDKPYRDLINLNCWLTPDSVAIELYCFPADILDRYIRIDPVGRLVLDTTTETYHREPAIRKDEDGHPVGDASSVAYEIRSEDLAIWVVYRWLKNPD